ncbi:unnamed protein product [Notodromas monacha]|uniref:Uncharacterized protein n=1 Tax=Notodromas monacha TaxID=399045 RepID=A0A7R9BDY5_9CRUS|nr:unnamed protein product [Notodromas monacha]CAG0913584.1 unnamed protein product [Notodromas monacha]
MVSRASSTPEHVTNEAFVHRISDSDESGEEDPLSALWISNKSSGKRPVENETDADSFKKRKVSENPTELHVTECGENLHDSSLFRKASPINIFLTKVVDLPATHVENHSAKFSDIISARIGKLKKSMQMAMLVSVPWVLEVYRQGTNVDHDITIVGQAHQVAHSKRLPNVTVVEIRPKEVFGSHHTKMMLLEYENCLRVVVHTANLVPEDWYNRTQGLWISPLFPRIPVNESLDKKSKDSKTHFKRDLMRYISAYDVLEVKIWNDTIIEYDFTAANSIGPKYGLEYVSHILKLHGGSYGTWPLCSQISSIGSLGTHEKSSWFFSEFCEALKGNDRKLEKPIVAAWGIKRRNHKFYIRSYEAGILLLPGFVNVRDVCGFALLLIKRRENDECGKFIAPWKLDRAEFLPCACGRQLCDHPVFAVIPEGPAFNDSKQDSPAAGLASNSSSFLKVPSSRSRDEERWSSLRNTVQYPTNAYGLSHFLLVDNGSVGRYGCEVAFRRKLEKYLTKMHIEKSHMCSVPMVCVIVEGGPNTIRTVLDYVTNTPPVPVVICDGSGRAADILAYAYRWSLEDAMMDALIYNRLDFVKLLLENGVSMKEFLTVDRLEVLYNCTEGPSNTLKYIVADVRPGVSEDRWITLVEVGLVLNKLMGGAFRSSYCRRKFRHIYMGAGKRAKGAPPFYASSLVRNASAFWFPHSLKRHGVHVIDPAMLNQAVFDHPFNDLMIWAVLTKRNDMAVLMWQHGEEAVAKALMAVKLFKAMAYEAKDDDLEVEVYEDLKKYAKEFEARAVQLMDFCYRQERELTQQLLTVELSAFGRMTCLSLAYVANHSEFLAHPCPQMLLADLWLGGLRSRKSTNLKVSLEVILGLILPPLIMNVLEFKTCAELKLQPQTEEECEDKFSARSVISTSSSASICSKASTVSDPSLSSRIFRRRHHSSTKDTELELTNQHKSLCEQGSMEGAFSVKSEEEATHNDSPVRIMPDLESPKKKKHWRSGGSGSEVTHMLLKNADQDNAGNTKAAVNGSNCDARFPSGILGHHVAVFGNEVETNIQLPLSQKAYEFYAAPVTKFWAHAIFYVLFLWAYTFMVLVKMPPSFSCLETLVTMYIIAFGSEKIRELFTQEPHKFSHKFALWTSNLWTICDAVAVTFYLTGSLLRCFGFSEYGRVVYCVDIMYWYIRILDFLSVNKYLGPYVTMIGKMVLNMSYFVILLFVMIMSFGVARQSLLFPGKPWSWDLLRDVFFQPYFMLYGEVFAADINPDCGEGTAMKCVPGMWITPILMSGYLLMTNVLLINLLIAVFNNIFDGTNSISRQIWMYQRYSVIMEYEQKPFLPPPFIFLAYFWFFGRFCIRRWTGKEKTFGRGLKLFLDQVSLERVNDFEEESLDTYCEDMKRKEQESVPERIKAMCEKTENISLKVNEIMQRVDVELAGLDMRLARMELVLDSCSDRQVPLSAVPRRASQERHMSPDNDELLSEISRPRLASVSSRHSLKGLRLRDSEGGILDVNVETAPEIGQALPQHHSDPRLRVHSMSRRRAGSITVSRPVRRQSSGSSDGFPRPPSLGSCGSPLINAHDADRCGRKKSLKAGDAERDKTLYEPVNFYVEGDLQKDEQQQTAFSSGFRESSNSSAPTFQGDPDFPGIDPFSFAFKSVGSNLPDTNYFSKPAIQIIPPTPPVFFSGPNEVLDDAEIAFPFMRTSFRPPMMGRMRRLSESASLDETETKALREAEQTHYFLMENVLKDRLLGVSEMFDEREEDVTENVSVNSSKQISTDDGFNGSTTFDGLNLKKESNKDLWDALLKMDSTKITVLKKPSTHKGRSMMNLTKIAETVYDQNTVNLSTLSLPVLQGNGTSESRLS